MGAMLTSSCRPAAGRAITVLTIAVMAACSGDSGDDDASEGTAVGDETSSIATTPPVRTRPDTAAAATVTPTDPATSPPTTETEVESTPPSTLFPAPPIEDSFSSLIPHVGGFEDSTAVDVVWPLYDLPRGASAYAVAILPIGSAEPVATLIVAGRTDSNQPFGTYARQLFDAPIPVMVEGVTQLDDGTMAVSTNNALASWQPIADAAVIVAVLPDADAGKWVWTHDELIWIVTGSLAAQEYVAGLVQAQGAGNDPFDFQGLRGNLATRFPTIPAVQYYDLPRADALTTMQQAWSAPCAKSFYYSYVPAADDPDPAVADRSSLFIDVSQIAAACEGFVDDLITELEGRPAFRADTIAGRTVYRSNREILYMSGDIVVHLSSRNPRTLVNMALVINAFISGQH